MSVTSSTEPIYIQPHRPTQKQRQCEFPTEMLSLPTAETKTDSDTARAEELLTIMAQAAEAVVQLWVHPTKGVNRRIGNRIHGILQKKRRMDKSSLIQHAVSILCKVLAPR